MAAYAAASATAPSATRIHRGRAMAPHIDGHSADLRPVPAPTTRGRAPLGAPAAQCFTTCAPRLRGGGGLLRRRLHPLRYARDLRGVTAVAVLVGDLRDLGEEVVAQRDRVEAELQQMVVGDEQ